MLAALATLPTRRSGAASALLRHLAQVTPPVASPDAAGSTSADGVPSTRHRKTKRDNRLRYLVISNQPEQALDLLERSLFGKPLPNSSPPRYLKLPPASVCNKVLDSALKSHTDPLLLKAAELADALFLQGVQVQGRTLAGLVQGLGRRGLVARALPVLDRWLVQQEEALQDDATAEGLPLQVLTSLMDGAARVGDPGGVVQVLGRMARVGLTPTVPSMTSLLQCFMRQGQVDTAHGIVEWMRRSQLRPTAHTYTALMCLPRSASKAQAHKVLAMVPDVEDAMSAEGVSPTPHYYASLIHVCGRAHDLEAAQAAWADMRAAGIQPDVVLFSTVIDACAKVHDAPAAMGYHAEMVREGVQPDVVAFASLLAALKGSPAAVQQAEQVWTSMKQRGVTPNHYAVAAYLDILLAQGTPAAVLQLLDEAVLLGGATDERGSVEDLAGQRPAGMYEQALEGAVQQGDAQLVSALVQHMQAHGADHTPASLGALLLGQAAQKSCSAAKWLLRADDQDVQALRVSAAIVESCLLGMGDAAQAAQGVMQGAGAHTEAGDVLALLGGLAVQAKPREAMQLWTWARERGMDLGWPGLRLLMFGALNACPPQPALVMQALAASRSCEQGSSKGGARRWWDLRTERAVFVALKKAPATAGLLAGGDGVAVQPAALEARLRSLLTADTAAG